MTMIYDGDEDFVYTNANADGYCKSLQDAYDKGKLDDMYEGFYDI